MLPTALAPTADLATPKVEKFVKTKLLPAISEYAKLDNFYLCEPGTSDVYNGQGEHWTDASWGAHVICDSFSVTRFNELSKLSETIGVYDMSVHGEEGRKIRLDFWLCARVMR